MEANATTRDPPESNLSASDVKNYIEEKRFTTMKNRTSKSAVWDTFEAVLDEDGEQIGFVYCTWCNKVLTKNKRTSSNLLAHPCAKKANIETTVKVSEEWQQSIASACLHWTITSGVPFATLAGVGLHKLLGEILKIGAVYGPALNVADLLPHPSDVASSITAVYNEHFQQIRDELSAVKYSAITADMLTDHRKQLSCIIVTMHYMEKHVLLERVLAAKYFELGSETDENIWMAICQALDDFGIKSDHQIFVTDPSSNLITTLSSCIRLSCAVHLIDSVLAAATNHSAAYSELCAKINDLVHYVKNSSNPQLRSTLASECNSQQNTKIQILNAIKNNWNDITRKLKAQSGQNKIDGIRLSNVAEVVAFLSHFEQASKDLQVSNRPTLHLCLPHYEQLKQQCVVNKAESNLMIDLKLNCGKFLLDIWRPNITMHHLAATFLFPPCKKLLVLPVEERNLVHAFVEEEYAKLSNSDQQVAFVKVETIDEPAPQQPRNIFAAFQEPGDIIYSRNSFAAEVMRYLDEPLEDFDQDYLHTYWQNRKDMFPRLYVVSHMLLVIPASNGASERAYDLANNITGNDVRTDCDSLNSILVLNSHFKIMDNA